jgi:hypothetical protein
MARKFLGLKFNKNKIKIETGIIENESQLPNQLKLYWNEPLGKITHTHKKAHLSLLA